MNNEEVEYKYYFTLKRVLQEKGVSKYRYSIGGYSEEAVCIEKLEKEWIVYDGERGCQCNKKEFNTIDAACREVLSRIFDDKMVADNAINRFRMITRRQVRVQTRREKLNSRSMNERKDNERKEKRVVSFSVR